jgi:hypothetical protein
VIQARNALARMEEYVPRRVVIFRTVSVVVLTTAILAEVMVMAFLFQRVKSLEGLLLENKAELVLLKASR